MKLRIFPKKEAVRELLLKRIQEVKVSLEGSRANLEKAKNALVVVADMDIAHLESLVKFDEQTLEDKRDELTLLESHAAQEVLCEIEIAP